MMLRLVLGGIKSGKSQYAEKLAAELASDEGMQVGYIATAEALDREMGDRIARHKKQRPDRWLVLEEPVNLASALRELDANPRLGCILIDCLTLWMTNLLVKPDVAEKKEEYMAAFLSTLEALSKPCVLVSNETNMGLIGMDELTRKYCDEIGRLHQILAQKCVGVDFVVAGLPVKVK